MEVKIGVADSGRELLVTTDQSPDEVEARVTDALQHNDGLLTLVDEKGRRFIVPTAKVAYVQIAPADTRRVGFAVGD